MDFIFMLTRDDQTIVDALDVLGGIGSVPLGHIGFKDVGVDKQTLLEINHRIKENDAISYMEVVSTSKAACLESARTAVEIGVDRLLGGTDVDEVLAILEGTGVEYFPFPCRPYDHPTKLGGTPEDALAHCRLFRSKGCAGADLLAYRATESDPLALVSAAKEGVGDGYLIVAGSVSTPAQIADLARAGADAFTIGTAVFDGAFSPRKGAIQSQLNDVLSACA